ncbi:hypothetical protein ACWXVQ_01235 [Mycoplasma sp. 527]
MNERNLDLEKKHRKVKKGVIVTSLLTAIPAITLAAIVPFLHNTEYKSIDTKAHDDLVQEQKKARIFLNKYDEMLSEQSKNKLQTAINYANQLIANKISNQTADAVSAIRNMLDQRNILRRMVSSLMLVDSNSAKIARDAIEQLGNLVKSPDLKNEFNKQLDIYNASQQTYDDKQKFVDEVEKIIAKQDKIAFDLELKMNVFVLKNIQKTDRLNISIKNVKVLKLIDFINGKLEQNVLSRDSVVDVLDTLFTTQSNDLFKDESINNEGEIQKIYSQIVEAKNQVATMDLDQTIKQIIYDELDAIKKFVIENKGNLSFEVIGLQDSKKITASQVISDYISTIINKTSDYFGSDETTLNKVKDLIAQADKIKQQVDSKFIGAIDFAIIQANNKVKDTDPSTNKLKTPAYKIHSDLYRALNEIAIANKLLNDAKEEINKIQDANFKQELINKIENQEFKSSAGFFEYVSTINQILSDIDTNNTLKNFYKEQFNILSKQLKFTSGKNRYNKTFVNDDSTLLNVQQALLAINEIDFENTSLADLSSKFEEYSEYERIANKKEIETIIEGIEGEVSKIVNINKYYPTIKKTYDSLKTKLLGLASIYSTATRKEMSVFEDEKAILPNGQKEIAGGLIKDALDFFDVARLSHQSSPIFEDNNKLLEAIKKVWKNNPDSPVAKDLSFKTARISADIKLIMEDYKLTHEQKEIEIAKLKKLQDEYSKKVVSAKRLENTKDETAQILAIVKNKEKVKTYLGKELNEIQKLKRLADEALADPTQHDLDDIQSKLSTALNDFENKRSKLESSTQSAIIAQLIDDTFSSRREEGKTTPVESKFLETLNSLQAEVDAIKDDKTLSEKEKSDKRQLISNKFDILRESIEVAATFELSIKQLEVENNEAKKVYHALKADSTNNNLFKTMEARDQIRTTVDRLEVLNTQTDTLIEKYHTIIEKELYNPEIHNKTWITKQNVDIANQTQKIKLEVAKDKLTKEKILLGNNKIADADLSNNLKINNDPFALINGDISIFEKASEDGLSAIDSAQKTIDGMISSIDALQGELKGLYDKLIKETEEEKIKAIQREIESKNFQIDGTAQRITFNYQNIINDTNKIVAKIGSQHSLLEKTKLSAIELSKVDKTKYFELYTAFTQVINVNRGSLNDSLAEINDKIIALNEINAKIEISKEVKDAIVRLQAVRDNQYKSDQNDKSQRYIFEKIDKEIEEEIAKFSAYISNYRTTKADLVNQKQRIEYLINQFMVKKQEIHSLFNDAKNRLEKQIDKFLNEEKNNNFSVLVQTPSLTNGSELQKLKLKFDDLISSQKSDPQDKFNKSNYDKAKFEELQALASKVDISFRKDEFKNTKSQVDNKLNELKNKMNESPMINFENNLTIEGFIANISETVTHADNEVMPKVNSTDVNDVLAETKRMETLGNLIEEQLAVSKRLLELKKNNSRSADAYKRLADALVKSVPGQNASTALIEDKITELRNAFAESVPFEQLKQNQRDRFEAFKKEVEGKFNAQTYDSKVKESLIGTDGLISQYTKELEDIVYNNDKAKYVEEVNEVNKKLQIVKTNLKTILSLAEAVKENEEKVAKLSVTDGPIKDVFDNLKKQFETQINDAKSSYNDPSKFSILSQKKADLSSLVVRLEKIIELNKNIKTLKDESSSMTYKEGRNNTGAAAAKEMLTKYVEKLELFAKDSKVNSDLNQMQILDEIVTKFKRLIEKQRTILATYDSLGEFSFEGQKYGYEIDQKNIGQFVNDSIPELPADVFAPITITSKIDAATKTLESQHLAYQALYNSRKTAYTEIEKAFSDENNMLTTLDKYKDKNQTIFDELKKDRTTRFKERLDAISKVINATDINAIDNIKSEVLSSHSLFEKYADLAVVVASAKEQVTKGKAATNKSKALTKAIQTLETEFNNVEKTQAAQSKDNFYFGVLITLEIEAKHKLIESNAKKIDILISYSDKLSKLTSSNDLDEEAKKPLRKILDNLLVELGNRDAIDVRGLEALKETYLEVGKNSFDISLKNSIELKNAITQAEAFIPTSSDNDYKTKESATMMNLYTSLQQAVDEAKNNLKNEIHNEENKLASIFKLTNPTESVVQKLKDQKREELRELRIQIDEANNFLTSSYTNIGSDKTKTPLQESFTNNAVSLPTNLSLDTLANIKDANEKLLKAKEALTNQIAAIIKFEKNHLTIVKNRLDSYVKLFKSQQVSIDNSNKQLTTERAKKLSVLFNIDKLINGFENNVTLAGQVLNKDTSNYKLISQELRNTSNTLENDYQAIKTLTKNAAEQLKIQINSFNEEMKDQSTNNIFNIIKLLDGKLNTTSSDNINGINDIKQNIQKINQANTALPSDFNNLAVQQLNINFNQDINASTENAVKDDFKKYYEAIEKIITALEAIDNLIYGSGNFDAAKRAVGNLINFYTEVVSKSVLEHMLNLVAGDNFKQNNSSNSVFANIINSYNAIHNSAVTQQLNTDKALMNKNSSVAAKQEALKAIFSNLNNLNSWINDSSNNIFLFDYLNKNNAEKIREIKPKSSTLYENFVEEINKINNQSNVTELDITQNQGLLNLFDVFAILKNNGNLPYNTTNVRVFITRTATSNSWAPEFLQTDTSTKKTKINLKVVYKHPSSHSNQNFFNDVADRTLTFNDVWITFKTLPFFRVTKTDLGQENQTLQQNKTFVQQHKIFEAKKAGWNNRNMNVNLMNAIAEGANKHLLNHNLKFIREDVSFSSQQWDDLLFGKLQKPRNVDLYKLTLEEAMKSEYTNFDLSNSHNNLKYKIKIDNSKGFIFAQDGSGRNFKHAMLSNGKMFSYWTQTGADLDFTSNTFRNWIPFGYTIPVVFEENGKKDFGVLHTWYELLIQNNINRNDASFKMTLSGYSKWYFYPPKDTMEENEINNNPLVKAHPDDVNIKAYVFAEMFASKWTDKTKQANNQQGRGYPDYHQKNHPKGQRGGKEWNEPQILKAYDHFDFMVKIHEDKEGDK